MSRPVTNDTGKPEVVLTAAQWRRIQAMVRAAERAEPKPDTGDTEPPTWENQ